MIDEKALQQNIARFCDEYGLITHEFLDQVTDFLGYGGTGVQDAISEGTTVKELHDVLVDLYERSIGRK